VAPKLPLVILLAAITLAFRVAAWLSPSEFIVIPPALSLPLGLLGVVYLVCGVVVWIKWPNSLTRVFLFVGLGGCIHWGGSVGADGGGTIELTLLMFYMTVTALGDGAFLDFALRYPHTEPREGPVRFVFYILAALCAVMIPLTAVLPRGFIETWLGLAITIAFVMSLGGGLVFLLKWFSASSGLRHEAALTPIVVVLVASSVLDLLADGGVMPGPPEAWGLAYAAGPIVIAWALLRSARDWPEPLEEG
jgi:hypothetical protein